ncbi:MAG: energy-coupled thiamine transporter ThiT [Clostridia bacterium]
MSTQKNSANIQRIVITAMLLALAAALSMVKIVPMPLGGSITLLSMLPISMIALCYGTRWGLTSAFIYALIQIALDLSAVMTYGLTPLTFTACLVCDYLLAYTALGLSGIFRKGGIKGICVGITIALALRFVFHVISGITVFAIWAPEDWNLLLYSVCYNGAYMLPEIILTAIAASVLFQIPAIKSLMKVKGISE